MKSLDILAFAPHPDDAEICCGGTLITSQKKGHKTGIVELTYGEMSTAGTVEERKLEVEEANKILKPTHRENLGLSDGWLNPYNQYDSRSQDSAIVKIVDCIRRLKPSIVLLPYDSDRHPDHIAASNLITSALFHANVGGYKTPSGADRHLVNQIFYYQMRYEFTPSVIVDISDSFDEKVEAIKCFKTQITRDQKSSTKHTLLNSPELLANLEARDKYYGGLAGVKYGEPLFMKNIPVVKDIVG